MNILIIDDDLFLAGQIAKIFASRTISNRIRILHSVGGLTLELPAIGTYDVIVTDLDFPEDRGVLGGYSLIEVIRRHNRYCPLIVMSGHSDIDILRRSFDLGADDYFIKPIRLREVELRIMHIFKKSQFPHIDPSAYQYDIYGLVFDFAHNEFYRFDQKIPLTRMNKYLLFLFFSQAHTLLRDDYLREKIWGDRSHIIERNIRITILRLRNVLKKYSIDHWIETSRGEGYIFVPKES